ncbi:MAG: hypothetical protein J0L63_04485 [Anaerolineae bacterium]|nr:hypothetical protein [Anaerolineae bacterium]MBN8618135.1 hypothetical protein [Anaerolineae bacterium]
MPLSRPASFLPSASSLADMAALAAHLGGSVLTSRTRPCFVGGCSPASRCHCRMAAAITLFPAAKSAKPASSRPQTPQPRARHARSRRQ